MPSDVWGSEVAASYDIAMADMFDPAVLDPTVEVLAGLAGAGAGAGLAGAGAGAGAALEFAIGTGRVALPLRARGVAVSGIELSPAMVTQLRAKAGGEDIDVVIGDMATTRVPGAFRLVYLVFNTIMNLKTQAEQVAVFDNAAAHLAPGGHFVVEVMVPAPHRQSAGGLGVVFEMDDNHVGIDTYDDPVAQLLSSHHWTDVDGRLVRDTAQYRYLWPSEMALMGRLAGLSLEARWGGWGREPFTAESKVQVAVFQKPV